MFFWLGGFPVCIRDNRNLCVKCFQPGEQLGQFISDLSRDIRFMAAPATLGRNIFDNDHRTFEYERYR